MFAFLNSSRELVSTLSFHMYCSELTIVVIDAWVNCLRNAGEDLWYVSGSDQCDSTGGRLPHPGLGPYVVIDQFT